MIYCTGLDPFQFKYILQISQVLVQGLQKFQEFLAEFMFQPAMNVTENFLCLKFIAVQAYFIHLAAIVTAELHTALCSE